MTRGSCLISAYGPSTSTLPCCSTVTRSARLATTFMLCSTMTTVRPSRIWRTSSIVRATSSAPIPAVGSSSSSTCGSSASARASSRARFRPYEREPAGTSPCPASPTRSSSSAARPAKRASARSERQNRQPSPVGLARASSTCWRGVSSANRLVIWKERATPRRLIASGLGPVSTRPRMTTLPAVGLRNPVSRLNRVVLPAPLGPTRACTLPSATSRSTPSTARNPRNSLVSPRARRTGTVRAGAPPMRPPSRVVTVNVR